MRRTKPNKLTDSINVPVPKALKRKVIELADREPDKPAHTAFARTLLQEGVERREGKPELAAASK